MVHGAIIEDKLDFEEVVRRIVGLLSRLSTLEFSSQGAVLREVDELIAALDGSALGADPSVTQSLGSLMVALADSLDTKIGLPIVARLASAIATTGWMTSRGEGRLSVDNNELNEFEGLGQNNLDPVLYSANKLIDKMSTVEIEDESMQAEAHLFSCLMHAIRALGPSAGFCGLRRSHELVNDYHRIELVGSFALGDVLTGGGASAGRRRATLDTIRYLCRSDKVADWQSLCDMAGIFRGVVKRKHIRRALLIICRKSDSAMKNYAEHTLRQIGCRRFLFWWV